MIIQCPDCQTRFKIADDKVPADGATVRCRKCNHTFGVSAPPPSADPQPESASPSVAPNAASAGWRAPSTPDHHREVVRPPRILAPPHDTDPAIIVPTPTPRAAQTPLTAAVDQAPSFGQPVVAQPGSSGLELLHNSPLPAATSAAPVNWTPPPTPAPVAEPLGADPAAFEHDEPSVWRFPHARQEALPLDTLRFILATFFILFALGLYGRSTGFSFRPADIHIGRIIPSWLLTAAPSGAEGESPARMGRVASRLLTIIPDDRTVLVLETTLTNTGSAPAAGFQVHGEILRNGSGAPLSLTLPCGTKLDSSELALLKTADDIARAFSPLGDNLANEMIAPGATVPCQLVFTDAPPASDIRGFHVIPKALGQNS